MRLRRPRVAASRKPKRGVRLADPAAINYRASYMSNLPPPLHEAEEEIMEALWARGEAPVREVMDEVNARAEKPRAYTTFMTVMARLDRKGLLLRRREGKTDIYRPAFTREEYVDLRAQAEVASLVDQYGDVALGHFARQMAELDPDRRSALERLARDR
jgi:predicted transcriptional regulator